LETRQPGLATGFQLVRLVGCGLNTPFCPVWLFEVSRSAHRLPDTI